MEAKSIDQWRGKKHCIGHMRRFKNRSLNLQIAAAHAVLSSGIVAIFTLCALTSAASAANNDQRAFDAQLLLDLNRLRTDAGSGRLCNSTELTKKAKEWLDNIVEEGLSCRPGIQSQTTTGGGTSSCFGYPTLPRIAKTYGLVTVLIAPTNITATQDAVEVLEYFNSMESDALWEYEYTDAGIAISDKWIGLILGEDVGGLGDFCVVEGEVNGDSNIGIFPVL